MKIMATDLIGNITNSLTTRGLQGLMSNTDGRQDKEFLSQLIEQLTSGGRGDLSDLLGLLAAQGIGGKPGAGACGGGGCGSSSAGCGNGANAASGCSCGCCGTAQKLAGNLQFQ